MTCEAKPRNGGKYQEFSAEFGAIFHNPKIHGKDTLLNIKVILIVSSMLMSHREYYLSGFWNIRTLELSNTVAVRLRCHHFSFAGFSALFTYVSYDHIVPSCSQAKRTAVCRNSHSKRPNRNCSNCIGTSWHERPKTQLTKWKSLKFS